MIIVPEKQCSLSHLQELVQVTMLFTTILLWGILLKKQVDEFNSDFTCCMHPHVQTMFPKNEKCRTLNEDNYMNKLVYAGNIYWIHKMLYTCHFKLCSYQSRWISILKTSASLLPESENYSSNGLSDGKEVPYTAETLMAELLPRLPPALLRIRPP